ncbi:MAG: hypothetical protein SFU25_09825 [Candidatus Caenarcaniphilales bacterium]|nr:hypothetical protein [Candidatus Caenarcaniphilales bacterium]
MSSYDQSYQAQAYANASYRTPAVKVANYPPPEAITRPTAGIPTIGDSLHSETISLNNFSFEDPIVNHTNPFASSQSNLQVDLRRYSRQTPNIVSSRIGEKKENTTPGWRVALNNIHQRIQPKLDPNSFVAGATGTTAASDAAINQAAEDEASRLAFEDKRTQETQDTQRSESGLGEGFFNMVTALLGGGGFEGAGRQGFA